MDVPSVTEDLVRQLREGYPDADLVYAGHGQLLVRRAHDGVVDGEHLYSSHRLLSWQPEDGAGPLDDRGHAARLTTQLAPIVAKLVAAELSEQIVETLNTYAGADIWADVIEKLPDFDHRIPHEYPSYVRSAYDQRHYDATATTAEFVGLNGRVTFLLDRRDDVWRAEYTESA